jgi:guanine nucleotide-binding protein G(i) subunit alpha
MGFLKIGLDDSSRVEDAKMLLDYANSTDDIDELSSELSACMARLWCDKGVQASFARSREYQLNDSAS